MFQITVNSTNSNPLENVICFDNDNDFIEFCLKPNLTIYQGSDGRPAARVDFTDDYLNALKNGKEFMIKDENSLVQKRGCVWNRFTTKRVKNVIPYYADPYEEFCK